MNCKHCGLPINGNDGAEFPERKALNSAESVFLGIRAWYHHHCHKERWSDLVTGAIHLDHPLNDCRFFVREGRTVYGRYERDGQRFPDRLWAAANDYDLAARYPALVAWLAERGWWPGWWESRKPEAYSVLIRQ